MNNPLTANLNDATIIDALKKINIKFSLSLIDAHAKYGSWTPKQRVCAVNMATEYNAPKVEATFPFIGIVTLFGTALRKGLKRPSLRFIFDGRKIVLSRAPTEKNGVAHPNAGCLYIKYDNQYCGKITQEGSFVASRGALDSTHAAMQFLQVFSIDPTKVGGEYGRKNGACCFCGQGLSDGRSLIKGYGPICADHWELPWGEESEENLTRKEQSDLAPDAPIIELLHAAHKDDTAASTISDKGAEG